MDAPTTALTIFTDSKGLVLLQQKTYDAPRFPGVWSLFGGLVEEDETPEKAAKREVKEELNLELPISAFHHFKTYLPSETKTGRKRVIFHVSLPDDVKLTLREGRGLGYFSQEEIKHLAMPEHIQKILTDFNFTGSVKITK